MGWAEFLLADILTSLSKPLSDAERAVCLMASSTASFPLPPSPSSACPASSPLVPAVMAAPYLWRLLQCLRSYADTGASSHLANGLKYSTALPSILLSHWRHRIPPEEWDSSWQAAWVAASLLNTLFSIYWDTEKDWGVPWLHSGRLLPSPSAKNVRLYGSPFLYASAIASNAALRLTWTHKLSKGLAGSRGVALAVCLAEAARRFQWCFFRVETELLKYERKGSKPNLHALPS